MCKCFRIAKIMDYMISPHLFYLLLDDSKLNMKMALRNGCNKFLGIVWSGQILQEVQQETKEPCAVSRTPFGDFRIHIISAEIDSIYYGSFKDACTFLKQPMLLSLKHSSLVTNIWCSQMIYNILPTKAEIKYL